MPPRKGIVKSGNAGNSSKASKTQTPASGSQEEKKLLFPPGYKYPLTILNERCQNNGWEKADVQTYQNTDGWTFAVTLCKLNKRTGEQEKVRMAPRPAYTRSSAIEARHWGATYALYRFCNGINLHLVLPPGPRDYWNELAIEHKAAPLHLQWMYAPDPFAARKEIEEQKARSTEASMKLGRQRGDVTGLGNVPEVKMATTIREAVEAVIKEGLSVYPEAGGENSNQLSDEDAQNVSKQLEKLGFSQAQIQNAMKFLTQSSAMATNLLANSTPLEAVIEYLVLHIPECDLPRRFMPSKNSSNPFITSLHSGSDDLKKRWIEEKLTKEAGWPINVVKEYMADVRFSDDEASLIVALGKRLVGDRDEWSASPTLSYVIEHTEVEAYGATFITKSELVMPLFSAPITVHVLVSNESQPAYPRPGFIPLYLSSETIPAYVRLHLLSRLLHGAKLDTFMDTGEGFCLAVMRLLEDEWEKLEREGRPDISSVLQHLLPRHDTVLISNVSGPDVPTRLAGEPRGRRAQMADKRSSIQIRYEFVALGQKEEYAVLLSNRQRLPAFKHKDAFLANLASHRVVVVIGETGCGKTTQLPQFILDSLILSGRGSEASIIVTQPRRLAAISVAKRVSAERLDDGSVGYAVRGESQVTSKTKLLFCTTGVALRRVASGDQFHNVSHVIVDEVHERSVDNDVLLLALKEILRGNHNLHVVLMSATINYEKFSQYFNNAPVLQIPGFSHPVTDYYLEDIEPLLRSRNEHRAPEPNTLNREQNSTDKLRRHNNRSYIDYQLIADVVQHIVTSGNRRGGILIFLSGVQEIRRCISAIRGAVNESHADIFPLHANLTNDEQSRVFKQIKKWKIIAATNVAETSITIDDVVYVVDTGKVKEMKYDPDLHLSKLEECWISRAAGRQRRGRAGRTCPGKCYKLYTREEENNMADFSTPEIHRLPLENTVLYVKNIYEKEDAKALLGRAIDPPRDAAFDIAWSTLVDLGAVQASGSMTPLGRYIAELPADVKLAKMLILGTIFRCLDPILTIVACLSSKPLFVNSMDKREEANRARARFSIAGSDLLTDVNAYDQCMGLRSKGESPPTISKFCERNFISPSTVQSITSLRNDFFSYLTDLGFIPHALQPSSEVLNINSDNMNLVKSVILGGLWPHVARVRVRPGAQKFDQMQAGTVAREIKARDYILYDAKDGRVFIHPGSILFDCASWKCDFITYSHKYQTDKVYLKGATQISLYALLLLGGQVTVNHVMGGLNVSSSGNTIKLKAWPRIGILVNQLRRLLDAQLANCLERTIALSDISNRTVLDAFKLLVTQDGMSE
ncbi:hypothetical protein APHAL10511_005916 [Amanita phalloides]|nr:hypothetical protein APHAL10511_005916 [Amanita phalloides]